MIKYTKVPRVHALFVVNQKKCVKDNMQRNNSLLALDALAMTEQICLWRVERPSCPPQVLASATSTLLAQHP